MNTRDLARLRHFSLTDVLEKPLTEESVPGLGHRCFPQLLAAAE